MGGQPGFFDLDERHGMLSAAGDPLERLLSVVDFELFRDDLEAALDRADRARDGRPPYDALLMYKVLVLQTLYTLSDDQTEYQIRDRLSFMRFLGLALEDRVPAAKTIWLFREQLTRAGAIERLFERFDAILRAAGYLAMGGQIVDATVVQARRPRLSRDEKATIRGGAVPEGWSKAKRAQMDVDGRWTLKRGRKRSTGSGGPDVRSELVIPVFGYKNHLGIDRRHGFNHQARTRQLGHQHAPPRLVRDAAAAGMTSMSEFETASHVNPRPTIAIGKQRPPHHRCRMRPQISPPDRFFEVSK